tara:strand:+ start:66 stop:527 length:462 start_codon:yes stop_codon:yes gene_type:complete
MEKCFECNNPAQAQHHVVPKVLGGTKTIPLCDDCHSKVHDSKMLKLAYLVRKQRKDAGGPAVGAKYWGGKRPYGFDVVDKIFVENEEEQKIIKDMLEWKNKGNSTQAITDTLNANGTPSATGISWHYKSVRKILQREIKGTAHSSIKETEITL